MFNFFFLRIALFNDIMWKIVVEPQRPQMTTWRMRFAHRITKAKHTHSEYVIVAAFLRQQDYTKAPKCYACSFFLTTQISARTPEKLPTQGQ